MSYNLKNLIESNISEIIADAWDDETSFEDLSIKWGLREKDTKVLMKRSLKRGSYVISVSYTHLRAHET